MLLPGLSLSRSTIRFSPSELSGTLFFPGTSRTKPHGSSHAKGELEMGPLNDMLCIQKAQIMIDEP